jgi:antitoxin (DNA-binding transcriptional repressor) of toxin-antitoxin stability system
MAIHIEISEAQARFLEIIQAAEQGESVIILKNRVPVVQIVAAPIPGQGPTFGSARAQVVIADDFDAPLDEFRQYMP